MTPAGADDLLTSQRCRAAPWCPGPDDRSGTAGRSTSASPRSGPAADPGPESFRLNGQPCLAVSFPVTGAPAPPAPVVADGGAGTRILVATGSFDAGPKAADLPRASGRISARPTADAATEDDDHNSNGNGRALGHRKA